jgi:hypothetical protein
MGSEAEVVGVGVGGEIKKNENREKVNELNGKAVIY